MQIQKGLKSQVTIIVLGIVVVKLTELQKDNFCPVSGFSTEKCSYRSFVVANCYLWFIVDL